jgi:hypothetical protein
MILEGMVLDVFTWRYNVVVSNSNGYVDVRNLGDSTLETVRQQELSNGRPLNQMILILEPLLERLLQHSL